MIYYSDIRPNHPITFYIADKDSGRPMGSETFWLSNEDGEQWHSGHQVRIAVSGPGVSGQGYFSAHGQVYLYEWHGSYYYPGSSYNVRLTPRYISGLSTAVELDDVPDPIREVLAAEIYELELPL